MIITAVKLTNCHHALSYNISESNQPRMVHWVLVLQLSLRPYKFNFTELRPFWNVAHNRASCKGE